MGIWYTGKPPLLIIRYLSYLRRTCLKIFENKSDDVKFYLMNSLFFSIKVIMKFYPSGRTLWSGSKDVPLLLDLDFPAKFFIPHRVVKRFRGSQEVRR